MRSSHKTLLRVRTNLLSIFSSLLAAGFFSKGHKDERLVIANANGVGRVEKAEWERRREEKKCLVPFFFRLNSLSS